MLIKNCKTIPELVEGYAGELCDILVEDKRIKGIYECGTYNGEADKILDAEGKYVLPGFFDLHVHLNLCGDDCLIDLMKTPNQQCFDALKYAQDTLKKGFTSIRDCGGYHNTPTALRDAINNGNFVGPTIYSGGRGLIPTEIGNAYFQYMYHEANTIDEIKVAVRDELAQGGDFIKVFGTGTIMNPGGEPGQSIYTQEELNAIVEMAKFKDTYVAVHCHGCSAIKMCIKAGVRTVEHATFLDDEAIEMLKGSTDTYLVPTLLVIEALATSVPESSKFMMAKAQAALDSLKYGIRRAYEEGLVLGFGTDTGCSGVYHGHNGDEFVDRRDFWGMKELDIIKQATINSAMTIGVDQDYGTIKEGKFADLVIVDGNPLENIEVLRDNIDTVIKWGNVVNA